jgi:hypothetical protein
MFLFARHIGVRSRDFVSQAHPAAAVARSIGTLLLWFAYEFLPLSVSSTFPTALTKLSRFGGCATIVGVLGVCTTGPAPTTVGGSIVRYIFMIYLAVASGNIVKEVSFALCGHLMNWVGADFCRLGMTAQGHFFKELRRRDGTWRRLDMRNGAIVREWTNLRGDCRLRSFKRMGTSRDGANSEEAHHQG